MDAAPPSAAADDANMQRAAQLQAEWCALRDEMGAIVSTRDVPQHERKEALAARMEALTREMADVLARAQEKLPPAELVANDEEHVPVLSLRGRHRVERTYDSSDSDGPPSSRIMRPPVLRDPGVSPRVVVESPAARVIKNERTVLTALGTKLRSTLRISESPRGGASVATASAVGIGRPSTEEREALKFEECRLERELRVIRRLSNPDADAQARAAEIATRLKEITDLSLDVAPMPADDIQPAASATASFAKAAKAFVDVARSPRRWGGGGGSSAATAAPYDALQPDGGAAQDAPTEIAAAPKPEKKSGGMRKGWGNLRSVLEKKVLSGGGKSAKGSSTSPPLGGSDKKPGGASSSPASVTIGTQDMAEGSEFAETRNRLEQRGEKLNALGSDAEAMREGASDFLAATRALRKKNTKRGIF